VFGSAFEPEHGVMRQRHRLRGTGRSPNSPKIGESACRRPDDPVFDIENYDTVNTLLVCSYLFSSVKFFVLTILCEKKRVNEDPQQHA
jgi:hypothetical protein